MATANAPRVQLWMPTRDSPHHRACLCAGAALRAEDEIRIYEVGATPVHVMRNQCTRMFLATEHTHLLFVDDDVIIPKDTIRRLLELNKPVATGFTPTIVQGSAITFLNCKPLDGARNGVWYRRYPDGPVQISMCGMSCCLIRREVFESLGLPWFIWPEKVSGEHMGEDLSFCARAREMGHEIWADGQVRCGHVKKLDIRHLVPEDGDLTMDCEEYRASPDENKLAIKFK